MTKIPDHDGYQEGEDAATYDSADEAIAAICGELFGH